MPAVTPREPYSSPRSQDKTPTPSPACPEPPPSVPWYEPDMWQALGVWQKMARHEGATYTRKEVYKVANEGRRAEPQPAAGKEPAPHRRPSCAGEELGDTRSRQRRPHVQRPWGLGPRLQRLRPVWQEQRRSEHWGCVRKATGRGLAAQERHPRARPPGTQTSSGLGSAVNQQSTWPGPGGPQLSKGRTLGTAHTHGHQPQ